MRLGGRRRWSACAARTAPTWPVEEAQGRDVVIVAGGIGLAPLRPAIYHVLAHRDDYGPSASSSARARRQDLLFVRELEGWRGRFDVDLDVTVDRAAATGTGASASSRS